MITSDPSAVASRLRKDFDDAFAHMPEPEPDQESFLGLGLRGNPYALRLRQIDGLLAGRKITPLPTSVPSFAGLAAHRGTLVAVYDLGMLLEYATPAAAMRWLVILRVHDTPIGLAFERFDGHYRIASDAPAADTTSPGPLSIVPGLPDGRPVIDLPSLVEPILQLQKSAAMKGAVSS